MLTICKTGKRYLVIHSFSDLIPSIEYFNHFNFSGDTAVDYVNSVAEPTGTDSTGIAIDSNQPSTSAQARLENRNTTLDEVDSIQKPKSSKAIGNKADPVKNLNEAWKKTYYERFVGTEEAESKLRCYNLVLKNMKIEKELASIL